MNATPILRRALLLALCAGASAFAQQNTNVRGTVTAFDGKTVRVAAREGRTVDVLVPDGINVSGTQAFTLADLKPGMVLGVTTIQREGRTVAIDVRPIPATARLGLSPFDLQPESTMTNATVEGRVTANDGSNELTLAHPGGSVKVLVPPGTPMSQAVPGKREDIKPGETIFIAARPDADGKLVALRVQVSTGGVKPTQ